ncbi:MAG TPA: MoaD/ThiS family protein [Actinoplanes sp.]|nr:MoaD/ThiS family protein [Actinoplanes sp.]
MPVIRVPGALRTEADGRAQLAVNADGSLRAVLDEVADRWPRLERRIRDETGALRRYVNVYVDGEDCRQAGGLDTPVTAATEIQVVPSVAGG